MKSVVRSIIAGMFIIGNIGMIVSANAEEYSEQPTLIDMSDVLKHIQANIEQEMALITAAAPTPDIEAMIAQENIKRETDLLIFNARQSLPANRFRVVLSD